MYLLTSKSVNVFNLHTKIKRFSDCLTRQSQILSQNQRDTSLKSDSEKQKKRLNRVIAKT